VPAPYVAVIGASNATDWEIATAEELGRALAEAGCVVVCGGLGGVMNAAARGCEAAGGTSIGILPGDEREVASRHLTVAIATGFGEARNAIVARSADVIVAVGGEFGTLSEIALALKARKPVVLLGSWLFEMEGVSPTLPRARDAAHAVELAFAALGSDRG
jgi:uncharacterized protein (TIGR00725 family)